MIWTIESHTFYDRISDPVLRALAPISPVQAEHALRAATEADGLPLSPGQIAIVTIPPAGTAAQALVFSGSDLVPDISATSRPLPVSGTLTGIDHYRLVTDGPRLIDRITFDPMDVTVLRDAVTGSRQTFNDFVNFIDRRITADEASATSVGFSLTGGPGDDTITGTTKADYLDGQGGYNSLVGGAGDDVIKGWYGDDTLIGGPGADSLSGGAGDDLFLPGPAPAGRGDTVEGWDGFDLIDYSDAPGQVSLELGYHTGRITAGWATGLKTRDVEGVIGTAFGDLLRADSETKPGYFEVLAAQLDGRDGDDTLIGEGNDDTLLGENGNDVLIGKAGDDSLSGGAGDDTITPGAGNDIVIGGPGQDTYVSATPLAETQAFRTTDGTLSLLTTGSLDTLEGIERLELAGQVLTPDDLSLDPRPVVIGRGWPDHAIGRGTPADELLLAVSDDAVVTGGGGRDELRMTSAGWGYGFGNLLIGDHYQLGYADRNGFWGGVDTRGVQLDALHYLALTGTHASAETLADLYLQRVIARTDWTADLLDDIADDRTFLATLFENALGRPAPQSWLDFSAGVLATRGDRAEILWGVTASDEAEARLPPWLAPRNDVPPGLTAEAWTDDLFRLYRGILDRDADAAGLMHWAQVTAGGLSYETVVQRFLDSAEYALLTPDPLDNSTYVETLYDRFLRRDGSEAEIAHWADQLDGGASRAIVAIRIAGSQEAIRTHKPGVEAFMRAQGTDDTLHASAGATLIGGPGADVFVFADPATLEPDPEGQVRVVIRHLEPWDTLDFRALGLADMDAFRDALSVLGSGANAEVRFQIDDFTVDFSQTQISELHDGMILI